MGGMGYIGFGVEDMGEGSGERYWWGRGYSIFFSNDRVGEKGDRFRFGGVTIPFTDYGLN